MMQDRDTAAEGGQGRGRLLSGAVGSVILQRTTLEVGGITEDEL